MVVLFKMLVSYKIIVLNFIYTEISEPPPSLVTPDVFDGWPLTEVRLGPIVYSLADSLTKLIELREPCKNRKSRQIYGGHKTNNKARSKQFTPRS